MPPRWQHRLLGQWNRQRGRLDPRDKGLHYSEHAQRAANLHILGTTKRLDAVRLPLDATDSQICHHADTLAAKAGEFATLYKTLPLIRGALGRVAMGHEIEPPKAPPDGWSVPLVWKSDWVSDAAAVARMADPQWWRRKLRAVHAKQVEGAAIGLGYVNRAADPYISNESVLRRAQQNERNAASLEATIATNEDGQEYTLAELAATGPANKAIRRAELMTRIAGFERIADALGHVGVFFTITCPSRMHKWATRKGGGVIENPKYDGTLPNEAQQHLAKTWARIRAALARRGIHQYGFRIAEPNHDGTPHWHCLVFLSPWYRGDRGRSAIGRLFCLVRRYALGKGVDRTERGAKAHRCDFKPIDKGRGSAAGYIAKYVSKNIDGYRLDKDLIGNDAVETSHRVEAWASTWRIRQFQQIGGPPVGVWRELRRVESVPANAPEHLKAAHAAVNKTKALEGLSDSQQQVIKGAQWDAYVAAQGGPMCGRRYAIRVEKADTGKVGKYGEPIGPVPIGVSTLERYQPEHMTPERMGGAGLWAVRRVIVESARHVWTIVRKAAAVVLEVFKAPTAPWTCVNNCTGGEDGNGPKSDGGGHSGGQSGLGESPGPRQNHGGGLRWAAAGGT